MGKRIADALGDQMDADSYELMMGNRTSAFKKAEKEEDAPKMLRLAAEIIDLARQHGDESEDDLDTFERKVLEAVSEIRPDVVDPDDLEEEDDEPSKKKPGKESGKRRDRDEEIERDALGRRLDTEDYGYDGGLGADDGDDVDSDSPGRDALGNRIHKDL